MPLQPEVNGVPVDWATVLSVPSGSNTALNPSAWLLTVTAAGAIGDDWVLWANGEPTAYTVGSGSWVATVLTPGAAGVVWSFTVAPGLVATYTVQALDTAALVAAGLELAIEALSGVASSALGAAITVVLDSGANFSPSISNNGAGTSSLSGVAGKDTPTEVATALEAAFAVDGFTCSRSGAALTVEPDAPGYLNADLQTDGAGTYTRSYTATLMGFDPQPTP